MSPFESLSFRFVVLSGALLCNALFGAAHVHAQEQNPGLIQMQEAEMGDDQRAKAHFRVGTTLYDAGRFNEAAEEWQKAFELSHRAELLYNVYVAYRDAASSNDKAIEALRRYLELGQIEPTRRIQLEARLKAAEEAQAEQNTQSTAAEPTPDPALQTSTSDAPAGQSKVLPIVLMGAGGALLVVSVITGLMVNGVESDLEDSCPGDRCPDSVDLDGKRSTGNTLIAVNAVTAITGVLSLGTGIVLYILAGKSETPPAPTALNFGCTIDGCGGQFRGQF